jgi:hypothetical protein
MSGDGRQQIFKQTTMMNTPPQYSGPFQYTLHLAPHDTDARKIRRIEKGGSCIKNFDKEVCQGRCPKIYIVRKGTDIFYVGYADQHIGSRLRYGLNPKHQKGYHGYGWKGEEDVELFVWVFEPFKTAIKKGDPNYDEYKRLVECVEAEIVFRIKSETGKWPLYQQEIHFGNDSAEVVKEITNKIIDYLSILAVPKL